ncbi:MAG: NUDIX domain-containing protein, partial [Candidatus Aenigmatarchaeota archaeon]
EDAVRREVKEETGLDVDVIEFIKPTEFIFDPVFYKRRHFVFLDFFCKAGSSDVQLNDEAEEFVWVTPEEALKMALEPYTRPLIEWLLAKKPRRA